MRLQDLASAVMQVQNKHNISEGCEQTLFHLLNMGLKANSIVSAQDLNKLPNLPQVAMIKQALLSLTSKNQFTADRVVKALSNLEPNLRTAPNSLVFGADMLVSQAPTAKEATAG